jgi:hypothetical protein
MTAPKPRFKGLLQQNIYVACRSGGADPASEFFLNGEPHRHGALHRIAYWAGRDGKPAGPSWGKATMTYACWVAGRDDRDQPLPTAPAGDAP